jgi:hypothetical protein
MKSCSAVARVFSPILVSLVFMACVNLKKPPEVATCSASAAGCSDEPQKKDAASPDDTNKADVQAETRLDAAEEAFPDVPSLYPETQDLSLDSSPIDLNKKDSPSDAPAFDGGNPEATMKDLESDVALDKNGGPEPSMDGGAESLPPIDTGKLDTTTDLPSFACSSATPVSNNYSLKATTAACFVTCDDMQYGWGCSSFTDADRTIKVNGKTVTCGGTLPAKKQPGNYYYFEISAGGHTWDQIHWSGTVATSCTAPVTGFAP